MNSHVQRYYDRNTARFLRFGHGSSAGAIHRAVWGPGVTSRHEAMVYVNALIAERAQELEATGALDAGCGVGGSMASVAAAVPRVEGITISTVQQRSGEHFLADRLRSSATDWTIHAGDFCDADFMAALAANRPVFDLVYFVESFIHASCSYRILDLLSPLLSPRGRILICDDFLAEGIGSDDTGPAARPLREYREGWHVENLGTVTALQEAAASKGFHVERTVDLTPYLELGRLRDRLIRALVPLLRILPLPFAWRDNFIGGNAIQECLRNGYVRYCLVELSRRAA